MGFPAFLIVCISIFFVTAAGGSALTAGHFWKSREPDQPKVTKNALPHHSAPRFGSVRPHSGIAPWARREGPSMAQRGYPGIHAGMPTAQCLRSASVVNGASRSRSRSKAKQERGTSSNYGAEPPLSRASSLPHGGCGCSQHLHTTQKTCGSELARDGVSTACLLYTSPSPRDGLLSRMPSSA